MKDEHILTYHNLYLSTEPFDIFPIEQNLKMQIK